MENILIKPKILQMDGGLYADIGRRKWFRVADE